MYVYKNIFYLTATRHEKVVTILNYDHFSYPIINKYLFFDFSLLTRMTEASKPQIYPQEQDESLQHHVDDDNNTYEIKRMRMIQVLNIS